MFFDNKYKKTMKQIDATFFELDKECNNAIWEELHDLAHNLLKKSTTSEINSFFDRYPYTPRIWAITFCSNTSGDILESGREHAYRGLLSMRGELFLKVFEHSTMKLAKEGIVSESKAKANIEAVKKTINDVG